MAGFRPILENNAVHLFRHTDNAGNKHDPRYDSDTGRRIGHGREVTASTNITFNAISVHMDANIRSQPRNISGRAF